MRLNHTGTAGRGAGLVELMVACMLGLLITFAIIKFYLCQHDAFNEQQGLARIQENSRFIDYLFSSRLKAAGYIGCSNITGTNMPAQFRLQKIAGISSSQIPAGLPASIAKKIKPGSDAIMVTRLKPVINKIASKIPAASDSLNLQVPLRLQEQQQYFISDCSHLEQFKIHLDRKQNMIKLNPPIAAEFKENAQLSELQQELYFISDTKRKNALGQTIYALNHYFINRSHTPHELIEGVEEMKIFYGLVINQQLHYLTAAEMTDKAWPLIKVVRLHLLLTSVDPVLTTASHYKFLGQTFILPDHLMRKELVTTIALRE